LSANTLEIDSCPQYGSRFLRRLWNSPCQLLCCARVEEVSNSSSLRFSSAVSSARGCPRTSSAEYWVIEVKLGLTYSTIPSRSTRMKALALCSTARRNRCRLDRKSTRLNSSHVKISYAVFCLK